MKILQDLPKNYMICENNLILETYGPIQLLRNAYI